MDGSYRLHGSCGHSGQYGCDRLHWPHGYDRLYRAHGPHWPNRLYGIHGSNRSWWSSLEHGRDRENRSYRPYRYSRLGCQYGRNGFYGLDRRDRCDGPYKRDWLNRAEWSHGPHGSCGHGYEYGRDGENR